MLGNQGLTQIEKEVLSELSGRLGIDFVVGSDNQNQAILSNNEETVKVKITDLEVIRRVRDKKPVSYQVKSVRCGKENCTKCPHKAYIYAYFRSETTGKVKSKYLGKYKR